MDAYYKSTAWYVNENDFSMFLAMVSFLFLADTLIASSISRRVFSIAAFFASVIVIYVNNSRAALLYRRYHRRNRPHFVLGSYQT